jgi:GNAT superfamily N-acetyltransferase
MIVLRDASGIQDASAAMLDLNMEMDPELDHIITHDPDGFFSVIDRDETLGFAAAFIRSRQCILSQLWVLPQHRGQGAGRALLEKVLAYGENSGAREFMALVPCKGAVQGLLLAHGFKVVAPVYHIHLSSSVAETIANALSKLLPGQEITHDLLDRTAQAHVDRIDRATRNITRESDLLFLLKRRAARAISVRQGSRFAAYGFGGPNQLGPIAGSSQDAALCALGRAIGLSLDARPDQPLEVRIPGPFVPAIEALLDGGGRLKTTSLLYGRNLTAAFDRVIFGSPAIP